MLDTNVLSALRVRGRNTPVEAGAGAVPVGDQYVTATTVAEIERGVVGKERSDARQGMIVRRWFHDHVLPTFADRVSHVQPLGVPCLDPWDTNPGVG